MMSLTIEGVDSTPALGGGYLIVKIDNEDFHIIGVPSPNLLGERHRDTVSENFDTVKDEEGNTFNIIVSSSNVGVDWTVNIDTAQNDQQFDLEQRINIEYISNDY